MAGILVELYIWSMKNSVVIRDKDVGCHTYHDKGVGGKQTMFHSKCLFLVTVIFAWLSVRLVRICEGFPPILDGRDLIWTPKNRRPEKLRDAIKEAEDLLTANECVVTRWKTRRQLQILLKNCVLITFQVSSHSGDVERILVDKTLQGKLCSDSISHAHITDSYIVCTFPDKSRLGLVYFNKKPPSGNDPSKKMEKLSSFDPKISYIDLPGSKVRRPERCLTVNVNLEWIVVWWSMTGQEALPWTPASNERDRANIVMFSAYGGKLEELCFIATDCDPVNVAFSRSQPRHIHTLEVSSQATDDISIDTCIYECSKSKIQRATVTTIPLKAAVTTFGRNHSDDKLVLGCEDGRLVLYDDHKRLTQFVQSALMPSLVQWHPGGSVLFVAGSGAEIQVFDMALNPLTILSVGEDPRPAQLLNLAAFFRMSVTINAMEWSKPSGSHDYIVDAHDIMMLLFDRGPVCMLQLHLGVKSRGKLGPKELIQHYLDHKQIEEAVNLLNALNWNTESTSCFSCLTKVVNYLLRLPLNAQREAALETSLGSFYAPVRPISEVIVIEYRDPISRLARRFFHQLLRYKRFDKAFLLAVDLHSRDLFMDIYYLAMDLDERALATVAKQKADDIEREMPTSEIDNYDSASDSCSSGSELQEDTQPSKEDSRTGNTGSTRTPSQELKHKKQSRNGQWKKTEEEIDEAYQQSTDPNDIVIDASRGLAGIPESVYSKVLMDNPFGWDKPDSSGDKAAGDGTGQRQDEKAEENVAATLHVVHFGMV
ncbi:WD repeat-containing and planar cell polarity effector protein fritz homolog [Anneissia japonica]|uniref:WD repeat-containing and planar cell polarity effector protein fritz homolog n=1 Tax=Anneissia japonica TaxID=1529436 RepID=UPI001425A8A7|nr:WD repeat-containing and planar cell polarity effector protein fritz homolog [Anneissia japonica]